MIEVKTINSDPLATFAILMQPHVKQFHSLPVAISDIALSVGNEGAVLAALPDDYKYLSKDILISGNEGFKKVGKSILNKIMSLLRKFTAGFKKMIVRIRGLRDKQNVQSKEYIKKFNLYSDTTATSGKKLSDEHLRDVRDNFGTLLTTSKNNGLSKAGCFDVTSIYEALSGVKVNTYAKDMFNVKMLTKFTNLFKSNGDKTSSLMDYGLNNPDNVFTNGSKLAEILSSNTDISTTVIRAEQKKLDLFVIFKNKEGVYRSKFLKLTVSDTILKTITDDTVPPPSGVVRMLEACAKIPFEQADSAEKIIKEIEAIESNDKFKSDGKAVEAKKLQDFGADLIPNITVANAEYMSAGFELSRSLLYICKILDEEYYTKSEEK